jgi:hypothetical protein
MAAPLAALVRRTKGRGSPSIPCLEQMKNLRLHFWTCHQKIAEIEGGRIVQIVLSIIGLLIMFSLVYMAFVVIVIGAIIYGLIVSPKETLMFLLGMAIIIFITRHPYFVSALGALYVGFLIWKKSQAELDQELVAEEAMALESPAKN